MLSQDLCQVRFTSFSVKVVSVVDLPIANLLRTNLMLSADHLKQRTHRFQAAADLLM